MRTREYIRMIKKKEREELMSNIFSMKFINSIPKTIDKNGCWIHIYRPNGDGYSQIQVGKDRFVLSRLSMCVFNNINYYNTSIECRHKTGCSKRCFNPEHLEPGTHADNMRDKLRDGTNTNANKKVCPKCGGEYTILVNKRGAGKGKIIRICYNCQNVRRRKKRK